MRWLLAVLYLMLFSVEAEACHRCGRSACVYAQPVVTAPIVQEKTDVYVIQSNYPAPLVGQGTSALVSNGGYQALTLPLIDPQLFINSSLRLVSDANTLSATAHERTANLVQRVAELQAPTVERLAAGQAASQVLRAAGLDPSHNTQGQSSAVIINRDASGQLQVLPLSQTQVQSLTTSITATSSNIVKSITTTDPPKLTGSDGTYPLFAKHCAACHRDTAQPGGGLFLSDDPGVAAEMVKRWYSIEKSINTGKMPKNGATLSQEEKIGLVLELDAMVQKGAAAK